MGRNSSAKEPLIKSHQNYGSSGRGMNNTIRKTNRRFETETQVSAENRAQARRETLAAQREKDKAELRKLEAEIAAFAARKAVDNFQVEPNHLKPKPQVKTPEHDQAIENRMLNDLTRTCKRFMLLIPSLMVSGAILTGVFKTLMNTAALQNAAALWANVGLCGFAAAAIVILPMLMTAFLLRKAKALETYAKETNSPNQNSLTVRHLLNTSWNTIKTKSHAFFKNPKTGAKNCCSSLNSLFKSTPVSSQIELRTNPSNTDSAGIL